MKKYYYELLKQYIRCNGDIDTLTSFASANGRNASEAKSNVTRIENLLSAVEIFIGKAVNNKKYLL